MATQERTTGETIYQACVNLHNAGRLISRQVLNKTTGLKIGILDDHVTRMIDNGRLRRVASGILELVELFPANRPISKTVLPDGSVTIEVGDDVVQLTPGEAQVLGQALMGEATVFAQLRGDRDVQDSVTRLQRQREDDRRKIEALTTEVARLHKNQQSELAFE